MAWTVGNGYSIPTGLVRSAFDQTMDAVMIVDHRGELIFANRMAVELLQFAPSDGIHLTSVWQFIDDVSQELIVPSMEQLYSLVFVQGLEKNCLLQSRSGTQFPFTLTIECVFGEKDTLQPDYLILVFRDESITAGLVESVNFHRQKDRVTGLANRFEFEKHLQEAVVDFKMEQSPHSVCVINFERAKIIVDSEGQLAGDQFLKRAAEVLGETLRSNDLIARLGSYEFGLLLWQVDLKLAEKVAKKLIKAMHKLSFDWNGRKFPIACNIGVVELDETLESWVQVLNRADNACTQAKNRGRNCVCLFQQEREEILTYRNEVAWVSRIATAIRSNQFELFQQRILNIKNPQQTPHYELLLRLRDDNNQLVNPGIFLPAAEKYDMINMIDRWVVLNSFRWLSANSQHDFSHLNINLSAISLIRKDFLDYIFKLADMLSIPTQRVCFEITETAAVANLRRANQFITALRSMGCLIALDDFGTGMSSFSYLKNLPVDYLKIDGEFVREIHKDKVSRSMVKAISEVSHVMGIRTVAEYVENEDILNELYELNVDFAQGYGIAIPEPINLLTMSSSGQSRIKIVK